MNLVSFKAFLEVLHKVHCVQCVMRPVELSIEKYSFFSFQASDGTYTGFIKVNLRLSRPVTVSDVEVLGSEGPTILSKAPSECLDGTDGEQTDKRTSFYLPSDCVKQIHISSMITTREVIQGLLKKFMVLDNPCKFALYKQMRRDGQGRKNWSCLKKTHDYSLFIISFIVVIELFLLYLQICSRSCLCMSVLFVWGW